MIAGHFFEDMPTGRVCACGKLWTAIAGTTRDDIGKMGIAHAGSLNETEYEEIEAERERIWTVVWDVAGGRG